MASGSYWQAYVVCPYYRSDDGKRSIDCEGITDASRIRLCFISRAEYEKYIEHYCCEHHNDCQVAHAIHLTYEGVFDDDN